MSFQGMQTMISTYLQTKLNFNVVCILWFVLSDRWLGQNECIALKLRQTSTSKSRTHEPLLWSFVNIFSSVLRKQHHNR